MVFRENSFDTMFRSQLEKTSALGTAGCYISLDNAELHEGGRIKGGDITLNYVDAYGIVPLSVKNKEIVEVAFAGESLEDGKEKYTVVVFKKLETGMYTAKTYVLDDNGNEMADKTTELTLGDVKPFSIYRVAEVNNLEDMGLGYGLPKIWNAIPHLKTLELTYNILFSDLSKADKIIIANDILCKYNNKGEIVQSPEHKKMFVLTGERLPNEKDLIHEYNPEIRIDELRTTMETVLSLLSNQFGYGTKKYSFEDGQIKTATEYVGSRQDMMQEVNKQRFEATQYITDIAHAIAWFSNTFHDTSWSLDEEIVVTYDDTYVVDKEAERERKRSDALSFDIPEIKVWYLMDAYGLTEEEAKKLVEVNQEPDEPTEE
jgi:A118 family predicted phage portal protein